MPFRATYHLWRAAEELDHAAAVVEAHDPDSLLAKELREDAKAMKRRRETVAHVPDMPEPDPDDTSSYEYGPDGPRVADDDG